MCVCGNKERPCFRPLVPIAPKILLPNLNTMTRGKSAKSFSYFLTLSECKNLAQPFGRFDLSNQSVR